MFVAPPFLYFSVGLVRPTEPFTTYSNQWEVLMIRKKIPLSARQRKEQDNFWQQVSTWKEMAKALGVILLIALVVLALIRLGVFDGWFYTGVVK